MSAVARTLQRHWLLSLLVLGGLALRVTAEVAYRPALLYIDSFRYLTDLGVFAPDGLDPIGYELLMLGPLMLVGGLGYAVLVQHLLGLLLGVAVYALLRRFRVRRWIAALAAAPVLLDAYQVQIEHTIMSDLLFQILLLLAIAVLTWRGAPGPKVAAIAGAVLAVCVLVRIVGITLAVPAVVFVLLAAGIRPHDGWKARWKAAGALAGTFAALLFGYSLYHLSWTGQLGLNDGNSSPLYGRAAVVADCDQLDLTYAERVVCPDEPHGVRQALGIDYYLHLYKPFDGRLAPSAYPSAQASLGKKVLLNQPMDMLGGVAEDFFKGFAPTRTQAPGDVPLSRWQFQTHYPMYTPAWYVHGWAEVYDVDLSVDPGAAGFLRAYQLGGGYAPGTALGVALLVGFAGAAGAGRARRSGLRAVCLLPAGLGTTVLLTAAGLEFSWRYQLPALVLAPVAAALGATAMIGRRDPAPQGSAAGTAGSAGDSADAATPGDAEITGDAGGADAGEASASARGTGATQ